VTPEIGSSVGPYPGRIPEVPERFAFVEVSVGEGEVPIAEVDAESVRAALSAADLDLVVHLPFRQPLATTVERLDRANREYLTGLLDDVADLGAETAVVHVDARTRRADPERVARERIAPQMTALADAGRERGVEVCFENVGNVGGTPLDRLGDLAERTDVALCFDVGHAYAEVGQDGTEAFCRTYADRIAHLHVHDVRARGDSHIPVGSGEIDFAAVGDALGGFDGTVTVEVFGDDPDYAELSAEKVLAAL
jgi:sugar phosphate isomerase/epimerase